MKIKFTDPYKLIKNKKILKKLMRIKSSKFGRLVKLFEAFSKIYGIKKKKIYSKQVMEQLH